MESVQQRVQASLARLQSLVFEKYGRQLEMVNRMEVELEDSDFMVPMDWHGDNFATAVIRGGAELSKGEQSQIEDLVRMLIEPLIVSEMIHSDRTPAPQVSNVVPLFPGIEIRIPQKEASTALVVGIETRNQTLAFQTAVDVHEFVGSWALLSFSDIESRIKTLNDLVDLGRSTLYVPEISELTQHQRELLAEFIKSPLRRETVIIVSSQAPYLELETKGLVEAELAQALQVNLLRLDTFPADRKKRIECIEMLLGDELAEVLH